MTNKHIKRWLTSFATRAMQIKTTTRYHFKPTWIAIMKGITIGEVVQKLVASYTINGNRKFCSPLEKFDSSSNS